jgi:cell wall assembly regulator SMI1
VVKAWTRLEEVLNSVSPETAATLAPPARTADLKRLARLLKQSLPSELEQSLMIHNGQSYVARKNKKGKTQPAD